MRDVCLNCLNSSVLVFTTNVSSRLNCGNISFPVMCALRRNQRQQPRVYCEDLNHVTKSIAWFRDLQQNLDGLCCSALNRYKYCSDSEMRQQRSTAAHVRSVCTGRSSTLSVNSDISYTFPLTPKQKSIGLIEF